MSSKDENSKLLKKLLRAGALRHEDYVVLDRLEKNLKCFCRDQNAVETLGTSHPPRFRPSRHSTDDECRSPGRGSSSFAESHGRKSSACDSLDSSICSSGSQCGRFLRCWCCDFVVKFSSETAFCPSCGARFSSGKMQRNNSEKNTSMPSVKPSKVTFSVADPRNPELVTTVLQTNRFDTSIVERGRRSAMEQLGPLDTAGAEPSRHELHRSVSAPAESYRNSNGRENVPEREEYQAGPRIGLSRSLSRTEAMREYLKKSTAVFFGVDAENEDELKQRWLDRRRRLVVRRCGPLKECPEEAEELRTDVDRVDGSEPVPQETVESYAASNTRLRKESVAKMTWEGLTLLASAVSKFRRPVGQATAADIEELHSRSVSVQASSEMRENVPVVTFEAGAADNLAADSLEDEVFFDSAPPKYEDVVDRGGPAQPPLRGPPLRLEIEPEPERRRWRRDLTGQPAMSMVNRFLDNSNRREYGMGVVGRLTRRSFRRSVMERDKRIKEQLDSFEDHRPYFTYWVCTVQVVVMLTALITYGLGPVGFNLHRRSGLVLVTSLSLQQVDYFEPANFWIGPRAADLIHMGAKFSPCMRLDHQIHEGVMAARRRENKTACCIRNDNSGCVQTLREECSDLTSVWNKWNVFQGGPGGRTSGSVCGQDPNYCQEPSSIAPFDWPDDITKWPKCRKRLPTADAGSKSLVLKSSIPAEHMVCEVIGHPCCFGIHGECKITTREYCDFVKGFFHEEASLCSQVSCMNDVCGMLPFYNPDVPDQVYRLWISLFLHAGILHVAVSVAFQIIFMRDLEKLAGPVRIGIIYLGSGIIGNLASALFVPYRAEVGPSGSHFGLIACLCVEVIHAWRLLRTPWRALGRLLAFVAILFLLGLVPWVDNFAHIFGFISGALLSYAFLPFIALGSYDRRRKLLLIGVCLVLTLLLVIGLVLMLYVWPVQDKRIISILGYLNCIPLTRDFCAEQNIYFNKQEVTIT